MRLTNKMKYLPMSLFAFIVATQSFAQAEAIKLKLAPKLASIALNIRATATYEATKKMPGCTTFELHGGFGARSKDTYFEATSTEDYEIEVPTRMGAYCGMTLKYLGLEVYLDSARYDRAAQAVGFAQAPTAPYISLHLGFNETTAGNSQTVYPVTSILKTEKMSGEVYPIFGFNNLPDLDLQDKTIELNYSLKQI